MQQFGSRLGIPQAHASLRVCCSHSSYEDIPPIILLPLPCSKCSRTCFPALSLPPCLSLVSCVLTVCVHVCNHFLLMLLL